MAEPRSASPAPEDRGQIRRQQILDAAAACFVREGFHGASIARIAKAAGMSPGNLYHFFASKEAVIAALVQRRLDQSLALFTAIEDAEDPYRVIMARLEAGLEERSHCHQAALGLEILAEAARNPVGAAIVQAADATTRERLGRLYRAVRQARGQDPGNEAVTLEVLLALFQGLMVRTISHPEGRQVSLGPALRQVTSTLI